MTDELNYQDYACRAPPARLWRVQFGNGHGQYGDSHTVVRNGDIVSSWCNGQDLPTADFITMRDFVQAVKCHWNWSCRHYRDRGRSRFISTWGDVGAARNWAYFMRDGWRHNENAAVTVYEIETSRLGGAVIFSSTHLKAVFNAKYDYDFSEFLVLDRIPRESIVATYTTHSTIADRATFLYNTIPHIPYHDRGQSNHPIPCTRIECRKDGEDNFQSARANRGVFVVLLDDSD